MTTTAHREQALLMLEKKGDILEIAREVSRVLRDAGIDAAVVGGVAVVLHGHVRTTIDVDVFVPKDLSEAARALESAEFVHDRPNRQFVKRGVPVHLVSIEETGQAPTKTEDLEQIRTVSLADLINMKLRSGTRSVLRSQDLADVIGLIRARGLTTRFAARIDKPLRNQFRKLVRAVEGESKQREP